MVLPHTTLSHIYVLADHARTCFASQRVGVQVTNATAEKRLESSSIASECGACPKRLACKVRSCVVCIGRMVVAALQEHELNTTDASRAALRDSCRATRGLCQS